MIIFFSYFHLSSLFSVGVFINIILPWMLFVKGNKKVFKRKLAGPQKTYAF